MLDNDVLSDIDAATPFFWLQNTAAATRAELSTC